MTTTAIENHTLARLLDAWDTTVLPKHHDGAMQEWMESLRHEFMTCKQNTMTDTPGITAIRAAMRLFESATCTAEIEAALDAFELASGPEEMARLINYIDAQQAEIARLRETITDTDVYISEILTREKNNGLVDQQNYARLVNAEAEIERLRADTECLREIKRLSGFVSEAKDGEDILDFLVRKLASCWLAQSAT